MRFLTRREALLLGTTALLAGPRSLAASSSHLSKIDLWNNAGGPYLRGAVITQRRIYPHIDGEGDFMGPGPFGVIYTQADFDELAKAGANAVLLSYPGIYSEKPPFRLDEKALSHLSASVEMARRARLFAVIGFRTGPGRSEFTFHVGEHGSWFQPEMYDDAVWRKAEARAAWAMMWQKAAAQFANNPTVVGYELMVEPNSNHIGLDTLYEKPGIFDPDIFARRFSKSALDWPAFYSVIVNAIRKVDTKTPVIINANNYGDPAFLSNLKRINDPRAVYSFHYYEPQDYVMQEAHSKRALSKEALSPDKWLKPADAFLKTGATRLAVTEFGVTRWAPGAKDYLVSIMAEFEKRGCNQFLFHWPSHHAPYERVVNAHNYNFGASPKQLSPLKPNALMDAISRSWARNRIRLPLSALGLRGSR